jgi:hypothetical protein
MTEHVVLAGRVELVTPDLFAGRRIEGHRRRILRIVGPHHPLAPTVRRPGGPHGDHEIVIPVVGDRDRVVVAAGRTVHVGPPGVTAAEPSRRLGPRLAG